MTSDTMDGAGKTDRPGAGVHRQRLPLHGIRVVDLTHVVSGPVSTMLMGDLGAEVIKVEPPTGEPYRQSGYPLRSDDEETNLNFLRFSRGKKSLVLDLKDTEDRSTLRRLVATADVFVENFRPGVLDQYGFGYPALHAEFPQLVYTSISGYGHVIPDAPEYRENPAYAIIAEAVSGLADLTGREGGPPIWLGFAMADIFAGLCALSATLAALRTRDQGLPGAHVDISMFDCCLLMNDLPLDFFSVTGSVMSRGRYSLQSPWGYYPTADGFVTVAVITARQWHALCTVIGRPDLADAAQAADGATRARHHDEHIFPAISRWSRTKTKAEAADELLAAGVAAAPVHDAAEAFRLARTMGRDMVLKVEDAVVGPVELVGSPLKIEGVQAPSGRRIPRLDEHRQEILEELERLERSDAEVRSGPG